VVPSVTRDGEFVDGATPEQIAWGMAEEEGYAISLDRLDAEVQGLAGKLLEQFPECTRYTKQQTNIWKEFAWHQTIGHAADWLALHYASYEPWEGMRAFVEKRKPRYMDLRRRAAERGSSEFAWGPPARECARCGAQGLPAGFEYCGICGAGLDESPSEPEPAEVGPGAGKGEPR
jgi:naphthoate synthase